MRVVLELRTSKSMGSGSGAAGEGLPSEIGPGISTSQTEVLFSWPWEGISTPSKAREAGKIFMDFIILEAPKRRADNKPESSDFIMTCTFPNPASEAALLFINSKDEIATETLSIP